MRLVDADEMLKLKNEDGNWVYDLRDLDEFLQYVPTIDPVKHGKWFYVKIDTVFRCLAVDGKLVDRPEYVIAEVKCSLCDYSTDKFSNYCPNCGARMDGD